MSFKKTTCAAIAATFVFGSITARAQDSGALLDLLVRKRLITDQEAEEVRTELTKEHASTPAGKWKLSSPINELELYGDGRVRYEIRSGQGGEIASGDPNDTLQRNRHRYRFRLGLRGTLLDDWFFGVRMETSASARSANVTFADESSGGPFSKDSDTVRVSQLYLGYKGFRDITLTAGRMANPFVTTAMVWDADINPEGLAQQYKHTFNLSLGGGASQTSVEGYSKDGTAVAATTTTSEPYKMSIEFFANFGQFVYDDANPENPIGDPNPSVPKTDAYLLGWQLGAKFNFTKDIYFQVAPTIYNYTGYGDNFNTAYVGGPGGNQVGVNSLFIYNMPFEFGWKFGEIPMRVFGDFAVNLDAEDRARAAGHADEDEERYAYQIGLAVGRVRVKRDWEIAIFWQHVEQYSLDPNLVDSDVFDSRVGLEGFGIRAGYALSDAITFNLLYARGEQIDNDLGTGGAGDIGFNPLDDYQIFQADLNVKF